MDIPGKIPIDLLPANNAILYPTQKYTIELNDSNPPIAATQS